jgi:hypothetical protein
MTTPSILPLITQITVDLADLERVVTRAEHMYREAQRTNDDAYLDALALNLHGFYAGAERIFEKIATMLDGGLPQNGGWHQALLRQMTGEVPTVRPAVLRRTTYECLEEYRAFRHVVRNVYTFNLRGARLQELATQLRPCMTALTEDLQQFIQALHQLA